MAVRQSRQSPVNGIAMGDLPEGTTTVEFTKRHQSEPRNDVPSAEEAEAFNWRVYRMDSNTPAYLGQHEGLPDAPDICDLYGIGQYHLIPVDPQTRKEIVSLKRPLRIDPPRGMAGVLPSIPTQPHVQPQGLDAQMILLEQQRLDAKEERQRLESERQRLDAEARQHQTELAREQAEQRRADRERSDKMLELGLGMLGTLAAGIPAALAGLKTMLTPPPPPPTSDSKVVDTLTTELHTLRAKLDKSTEKQPDPFENTLNRLMQIKAHKALLKELEDTDEDDSTMGLLKEGLGMAKEALPMLGSLRGGQQQPEQHVFSSPEALGQAVMRDPVRAQETLQELARRDPGMAQTVINTLQSTMPRQIEAEEDDAPVPIGKRRQA